jgi:heme o synthase
VTAVDARVVAHRSVRRPLGVLGALVALTKPRIIELLLVTTVPTMILAAEGIPSLWLVTATLIGGTLAAASANTLNCVYDRDIDQLMNRTHNRPLVTGAVSVRVALAFGVGLGLLSVAWLAMTVNVLSAALALAAIAFYVGVYTMLLKRRTPQNIVWGGAAGCMPVLIGWSAVTGGLGWTPWVLFAVIFLWTPPHYWPLSLRFRDDYAQAGVPMLPVVAKPSVVVRQIVIYSWAMIGATLVLWAVAPMSWLYGVLALVAGGFFLTEVYALRKRVRAAAPDLRPMRLFHGSITYLTVVFLAIAIDPLLPF